MRADVVLLRVEASRRSVRRQLGAGQVLELQRLPGERVEHRDVRAGAARACLVEDDRRPHATLGQVVDDRELVRRRVEQVWYSVWLSCE